MTTTDTETDDERQRHVKHPTRGPWDWRSYLPKTEAELNALRLRAAQVNPEGVHLGRFLAWVEAEMTGADPVVSPRGRAASTYRRVLYELQQDLGGDEAPPITHGPDVLSTPPALAA